MRRYAAVLTAAALTVGLALPALAADLTVVVEAGRREHHGPVPALLEVGRATVPDQLVGRQCEFGYVTTNNTSVHDTDLVIVTGTETFLFTDIELGEQTGGSAEGQVGGEVVVYFQLNEHNLRGFAVSSLGAIVTVDCPTPETTTTTNSEVTSSTTTTTPASTVPATSSTTTTPAPTTTSLVPPTSVSSTTAPPSTPSTSPPSSLAELPQTGISTAAMSWSALAALVAGAGLSWLSRNRGDA